jgi:hypothetical protein
MLLVLNHTLRNEADRSIDVQKRERAGGCIGEGKVSVWGDATLCISMGVPINAHITGRAPGRE